MELIIDKVENKVVAIDYDHIYTVEAYFELEKTQEIRHEFVHGKLIPLIGESLNVNKITTNCFLQLREQFLNKGCEIYLLTVRLIVEIGGIYRYPDLVLSCEDEKDTHATQNPCLIIETLTPGIEKTDIGDKLLEYTTLPSLKYYLLIHQDERIVEVYERNDTEKGWHFQIYTALENAIPLKKLDGVLEINKIYKGIKF